VGDGTADGTAGQGHLAGPKSSVPGITSFDGELIFSAAVPPVRRASSSAPITNLTSLRDGPLTNGPKTWPWNP
jgi:hypothetical protein